MSAALERAEVAPEQVEHVVFGQVLQAGQGQIPSRQAQIKAGIPKAIAEFHTSVAHDISRQAVAERAQRDTGRGRGTPRH